MRTPPWFKQKIAEQGGRVLVGVTTHGNAVDLIVTYALTREPDFVRSVVTEFVRRQFDSWSKQHDHGPYTSDEESQLDLFPEIPRRLETAPGRFADQAVMTGKDWDNALKQARTKASNASGYAEAIQAVYDQVRPLFRTEEETTAEVIHRGIQLSAVGGA